MKFEMKKPIFECPYCHEKIEGVCPSRFRGQ